MSRATKPVSFSGHAVLRLGRRGVTQEEVTESIRTSDWRPADLGRWECHKDFAFNADWHGHDYRIKRVRPIFADEPGEIVVVTVYAYYF